MSPHQARLFAVVMVTLGALFSTPSNGIVSASASVGQPRRSSDEAYATLLYGNEFLLGARVLGKSLRNTGTTKDMVALVSDGVSAYARELLQADGWIVTKVDLVANPNRDVRPRRLWGVYTKLRIFNMTDYKKVVYLDADTMVVKNIEKMFKCGKFCAVLKHSERFNAGVLVVEPSQAMFEDMMSKVNTLESYTGGDQGFLESYFPGFANARIFEPNLPPEILDSRPVPKMERLPTIYNADVGQCVISNNWKVNASEIGVLHYTIGPLKPWDWWTSWLLKPVDAWQNVREQLPESLPGTGRGGIPDDNFLVKILLFLPFVALFFCYHRSLLLPTRDYFSSLSDQIKHLPIKSRPAGTHTYNGVSTSSTSNPNHQAKAPVYLGGVSVIFSFVAALVALSLAFAMVPRQVMPWTGLLLVYEWIFTIFFLLFGGYLRLVYHWAKATAVQSGSPTFRSESLEYDSGKGHQRLAPSCDNGTWYYWLQMAVLAIAIPLLPSFLGLTSLLPRVVLMVAGGLVLTSFMTYASEHLAIRSFQKGVEDRDTTRSKNTCLS